jgi:hypothetical protein
VRIAAKPETDQPTTGRLPLNERGLHFVQYAAHLAVHARGHSREIGGPRRARHLPLSSTDFAIINQTSSPYSEGTSKSPGCARFDVCAPSWVTMRTIVVSSAPDVRVCLLLLALQSGLSEPREFPHHAVLRGHHADGRGSRRAPHYSRRSQDARRPPKTYSSSSRITRLSR